MSGNVKNILWWGRFSPEYSRNVVLREVMENSGFHIADYIPVCSQFGDVEAIFRRIKTPDLVWVGCFRQRDISAAVRWARRRGVAVVFDPLISHYDKVVNEFKKYPPGSFAAKRLLSQEQQLFRLADIVVADTIKHAEYYNEVLGVPREKIKVVYVGADSHFDTPQKVREAGEVLNVLFYGSFLPLQGPNVIVEAARKTVGRPIRWTIVGDGPEKSKCVAAAKGLGNVEFRDSVPYSSLPSLISEYDVLLGIFGVTEKSLRVMPNKFFQAIASGKPIVTMISDAYPETLHDSKAIKFIPPGDADSLAKAVLEWNDNRQSLLDAASEARALYEREFGPAIIKSQIDEVMKSSFIAPVTKKMM
jgi:glycosyltransferase involved in cell wall biosynthesis